MEYLKKNNAKKKKKEKYVQIASVSSTQCYLPDIFKTANSQYIFMKLNCNKYFPLTTSIL